MTISKSVHLPTLCITCLFPTHAAHPPWVDFSFAPCGLCQDPGERRCPTLGPPALCGRGRRDGRLCLVLRISAQKGHLGWARRPCPPLRRGPAERAPGISGRVGIHVPQSDTHYRKVRKDRAVLWSHDVDVDPLCQLGRLLLYMIR